MKTSERVTRFFKAEPRTPLEASLFTVMTVTADGAEIYLRGSEHGVLRLPTANACAVLAELAQSAQRRLLEMEVEGLGRGDGGAAAAPLGAAGEADRSPAPG